LDIYKEFTSYGIEVYACDPYIDADEYFKQTGIKLVKFSDVSDADCLVFLVGHDKFKSLSYSELNSFYHGNNKVLIDVKNIFDKQTLKDNDYEYWSL
jgi:UDP-N-acetyl-D-galactosamine dehydrogenase